MLKNWPTLFLALCFMAYDAPALENRTPSELSWFKTTDAQLRSLASLPKECLQKPISNDVRLGRLAFNSPRLLGGQAGRMGLSCGSCHRSGRGNDDFFIEQLSERPGTADISHHFLSSAGGDQVFNPKLIPDLANRPALKIQDVYSDAFTALLRRLIEIEFDGQRANDTVFESIRSYLDANSIDHCDTSSSDQHRSLGSDWVLVSDGLNALKNLDLEADASELVSTTHFIASSLRARLETFYRLYSIQANDALDRELKGLSMDLKHGFMQADEVALRASLGSNLKKVETRFAALKQELVRLELKSYYNSELAKQALIQQP